MEHPDIYLLVKQAHIGFVVLSLGLFVFRGALAVFGVYRPNRVTNIVIHGVDTLLLLCGVSLAVMISINPFVAPWLMAKLIGLVVFVLIAGVGVRRGRTKSVRLLAFILAIAVFLYIVTVAVTKNPLIFN